MDLEQASDITDTENKNSPSISSSIASRLTFATYQNDVAVIADILIHNPLDEILEDIELVLECDPPLIASKTWKIDRLSPNSELRIRDRKVSVAGALLSELNERLRAELRLVLRNREQIFYELQHDLVGLARNEWGGAHHMPELLAAFVMPNDPAVSLILKQAGEALRSAGKQPALDGYQSKSRQRVWEIVSAIWTAISSRRFVYAEPPASFELEGQKIRTPSEVVDTGLATCLDSALLFAAAIEQAGLNPIITLTKGHAFCGVWLQPQQMPALTSDDCSDLRKYIALKELVVFETTMVVTEPPSVFSKAVTEGNRRLSEENEHEFIYALDIKRARGQQITPLGAVVEGYKGSPQQDNGIIQGLEEAPQLPGFDIGIKDEPVPDTPETRLDHWKRKLLDLTKRNRLLNLKPSKTAIRLHCPNPAVLEDKLADGKEITVIPMMKLSGQPGERDDELFRDRTGDDFTKRFIEEALNRNEIVSDLLQSELDSGLVQLYRKAKTDLQEGGANTLYLALGVLKWKQSEHEQRTFRAPLILIPIKLERRSAASKVRILHHEDEPVFNMTLLEMLRQDFDLRMAELEGELPKDESGVDVPKIWEIVRRKVRDIPGFEVVEDVVLSTFSFAKYLMWKDLADRTDVLKECTFVRHLIDTPREPYEFSSNFIRPDEIDEKIDPSELFMPLPGDSSQITAVQASSKEGDFVLEGPPGTGKSQTIANIIAHNIGLGRKVLFLSEKMAALEVVYRRLREKGLGDFCLELHSNKANKRDVLNQLGQSWTNRNLHSQAEWKTTAAQLRELRDELNTLVRALHVPGMTGVSPRFAISRAVRWGDIHRLRLDWTGGLEADRAKDKTGLNHLQQVSKRLGQTYAELEDGDKIAFENVRNAEWSNAWQNKFVEISQKLAKAIDQILLCMENFLKQTGLSSVESDLQTMRGMVSIAKLVPIAAAYNLEFGLGQNSTSIFSGFQSSLSLLGEYNSTKSRLSCSYPDQLILEINFDEWKNDWAKACASPWIFGSIKCWLFSKKLRKYFGLSSNPEPTEDMPIIEDLRNIRKKMDSVASELPGSTRWRGLDTDIETAEICLKAAKDLRAGIARLAGDVSQLSKLCAAIRVLFVDGQELLQAGMPCADAATALVKASEFFDEMLGNFIREAHTTDKFSDNLVDLRDKMQAIVNLQPRINTWCRWQAIRREAETIGLQTLIEALENGTVEPLDTEGAFKTAYCIWLASRLVDERKELRTFSAVAHEEKIKLFREIDEKVSDLSIDYIRASLSSGIPHPEDKNRPQGYGILSRELQKRMRHKPIRQLVSEMGDALTALTPCLLMSPLSASQFLSADNRLFDLVVFDEASQITVWDAIGAIARGKNVIVVGDPKQMPPTSFFDRAASTDGQDDSGIEEDLESILDESLSASVKLHRLTGHYRSKHESLIAFSNHRYYGGELVTYPSSETRNTAVSFVKVEGIYQRGSGRTNPEEAKAVVSQVISRLNDPVLNQLSIGVVTLNSEQQRLIDDLLDQERRNDPELERFFGNDAEEPVFVKNLETVQGDQRDVILLSIGYGPDTPGAQTMSMNFGPLNRKGGERRLNVAITRATSEIVVFASFDPSMIDLTRTSSEAVRDLKHYLEFAQRGPSALGEAVLSVGGYGQYDSDFEEAVAIGLQHRGWTVHPQVGVSKFRIDLGIVHPKFPGNYLAGIECDGATYHSLPSARDRDRVRHAILENLGWKLLRIWSTDYFIDPKRTLDRVHDRLKFLLDSEGETGPQSEKEVV